MISLVMVDESISVYVDNCRLLQDVVVSADRTFVGSVTQARTITLKGTLFYQACDLVKCYLHQKSGVSWDVRLMLTGWREISGCDSA
jgi:hypothetical protein